jgi:tetratricopeptide (TPR) repeat protein
MRALVLLPLMALLPATMSDGATPPPLSVLLAGVTICSGDDGPVAATTTLMPGYGGGGFAIVAARPEAQAFFDNGMQLGHAFAHKAASAAFAEAVRLDPSCAMCLWGAAWSDGPTINYAIDAAAVTKAAARVDAAVKLLTPASPAKERELIAALKLRYRKGGGNGAGDFAFARAMDALAVRYSQDDEIVTLAADAWMVPASLANATQNLPRAVALLETVLKRNPDYTPAIHFYIHATEMSGFPARAEPFADKLPGLAPRASHLVHMPSHTFYWVGRYQDAADANVRAVAMGIENARRQGLPQPGGEWQLPYHGHNVQYGVGGALMSGDAKDALALSAPMLDAGPRDPHGAHPFLQMAMGTAYAAEGRFADPKDVLALPEPGDKLKFAQAYRHYARGEAQARLGDAAAVRAEMALIPDSVGAAKEEDFTAHATRLMRIGRLVLEGRALRIEGKPMLAARVFEKAAKLDETKMMAGLSDPPAWWYPVRRSYAAALLLAGHAKEALQQTDLVLARRPNDPVTLSLRADAEVALGQSAAAAKDRALAKKGWHGDEAGLATTLA